MDASVKKVSDLFYPNTMNWNIELLESSFYPWEVETIRRIYVSKLHKVDCLVWPLSPDGSYTGKTAYHMLASEVLQSSPSSFSGMAGNVWKRIWKIRTPQKIKHFIWRVSGTFFLRAATCLWRCGFARPGFVLGRSTWNSTLGRIDQ